MKLHITKSLRKALLVGVGGCAVVCSQATATEITAQTSITTDNKGTYSEPIAVKESGFLVIMGNNSSECDFTGLGDITMEKNGEIQINSVNNLPITLDNTITLMGGSDGTQVQATFAKNDGKDSWKAVNFRFEADGNGVLLKPVGTTNTLNMQDTKVDIKTGTLVHNDVTFTDSVLTVGVDSTRGLLRVWDRNDTLTLNNSTIKVVGGTNHTTTQATFKTKADSTSNMTMESYKLTTVNNDNAAILENYNGSTALLNNAEVDVTGKLFLGKVNFTNSSVTIKDGATLAQAAHNTTAVTFDTLTIEEGGTLTAGTSANYTFNGTTSLTLTSLGGSNGAFTTNALKGTMTDNASLALSFSDTMLSSIGNRTSFTLTFNDLFEANSASFGSMVFSTTLEGWDVAYIPADIQTLAAGTTPLTLTFTKAVPEPTTATLSLLALAGLAARRRRK